MLHFPVSLIRRFFVSLVQTRIEPVLQRASPLLHVSECLLRVFGPLPFPSFHDLSIGRVLFGVHVNSRFSKEIMPTMINGDCATQRNKLLNLRTSISKNEAPKIK